MSGAKLLRSGACDAAFCPLQVNVGDAQARTEKGVENLQQAAGYQKKYRRWLLFLLLVVALLGAGIAAYFIIEMQKKQ